VDDGIPAGFYRLKDGLDTGHVGGVVGGSAEDDVIGDPDAVDLGGELLSVARDHASDSDLRIDYRQISVEALAEEAPGSFDHVTCMEMLEHVPDPASVVRACATLVKPGGRVFFSTLNRKLKAYLLAIVSAEYLLNMIPKGTHDFSTFIRPSELTRWSRSAELTLLGLEGVTYNPLTSQFSLSVKDIDVNYLAAFEKPAA
jgi:2-polyprenyl-6-hydroxyphenyl methylase/3-demethylubiquinone-9 3-methyltransferase